MKKTVTIIAAAISFALVTKGYSDEAFVHFAGQIVKPGFHKITTPATVEELEKACGGWTEFGSAKGIKLIRLARSPNATTNDPGEPETTIYELAEIPREGDKLVLKRGDIVFIPEKRWIGQ